MTLALLYGILIALACLALLVILLPICKNTALPVKQRKRIAGLIALAYLLLSLGLYSWIGAPRLLPLLEARDQAVRHLTAQITQNLERIKKNSNDLGAWVSLGADFLKTGQIDAAVRAFKQAVLLSGGDPDLILAYAKAQILQADGQVTDNAARGLEMVLMMQPDNPEARYFMAVRKLQAGQTKEAMKEMKALYHALPEDSPVKAMINEQIGRAR